MTLSELHKWRKQVPFYIFALCTLLGIVAAAKTLADVKSYSEIIVPCAAALAFFYVGLGIGARVWRREIDAHVGEWIREGLFGMIPADLAVTRAEMEAPLRREALGDLTGVFWEAVEENDVLRSQKEHFYSNGAVYSTAIDVFVICGFAGLAYLIAFLLTGERGFAWLSGVLVLIAVASRAFVVPSKRARHLDLCDEQLKLMRREQSAFVAERFRQIILNLRSRPVPRLG